MQIQVNKMTRIQVTKMMRILADPDPQHFPVLCLCLSNECERSGLRPCCDTHPLNTNNLVATLQR
jgi:hypothetical protein